MAYRTVAALLLAAALAACAAEQDRRLNPYGMPDSRAADPATKAAPTPEMAPGRRIAEQDCAKPVTLEQGNLRCK